MKFRNKFIVALMFFIIKAFQITTAMEDHPAVPLVITSDQERRLSNCAAFTHDGSGSNTATNWKTSDDTTLNLFCTTYDCCNSGGNVNVYEECDGWNTAAQYTLCSGSCKNGFGVCYGIARYSSSVTAVEIGIGSCRDITFGCLNIGSESNSLTRIEIPANECNEENEAGVLDNQLNTVGKCNACGYASTFDGTFVATDSCCAADGEFYDNGDLTDVACNYNPPEEPNPCKNVNCSNRGKCQVLSFTEAECKCENTFIQSETKLDCICPSDHEFNANANRCFPITEAPSKSPTSSPVATPSLSPSQEPTEGVKEVPCEDDANSTFTLDIGSNVNCKWILKNKKRRSVRKAKYCVREEVMNMCPVSCDTCSV